MIRTWITLFLLILSLNLFSQMRPGQHAADLSLPDLTGKMVSLSEFKGKVVLLFAELYCAMLTKFTEFHYQVSFSKIIIDFQFILELLYTKIG